MINLTTRVRENKVNKKGETRVLIMLYSGKKTKEISTGVAVNPKNWDKTKHVLRSDSRYQTKNSRVRKCISELRSIIDKQSLLDPSISIEKIVSEYRGKSADDPTLYDYMKGYLSKNDDNIGVGTTFHYLTCLKRVEQFNPNIKLSEVSLSFIGDFEKYLALEYNNRTNTIKVRLKDLKKVMRTAYRKGLIKSDPFAFYKIKHEETHREYLTIEELRRLEQLSNLIKSQELVRDIYLFSAYAGGLRFGDMCTLELKHIVKKDNDCQLRMRAAKTDNYISFKLNKVAVRLIDKYSGTGTGEYVFPILSKPVTHNTIFCKRSIGSRNASFNKVIKKLALKAGIDKYLTMHTARHTHATISLNLGIQTEVVGKIMGHKDLKTTQIYTNILDKSKDEAMDKWDSI